MFSLYYIIRVCVQFGLGQKLCIEKRNVILLYCLPLICPLRLAREDGSTVYEEC